MIAADPELLAAALASIDHHFGYPRPDRRQERWVPCPFHGERRRNSFSYGPRGYCCFACDARGSLRRLAEELGLAPSLDLPIPRPRPAPPPPPEAAPARAWQQDPRILERFQPIPPEGLAYARSRGLSAESIARWRIGWGMLPSSRARYPRLILPIVEGGRVVGLRGRAVDRRDDAPKWLQSAGSSTTLFGLDRLAEASGRTVLVAEAPLSCVLAIQQHREVAAVAPTASSTWREGWTAAIAASQPKAVVVWYDADQHGETYGLAVARELAKARLPVRRYRWPRGTPPKTDLADVVLAGLLANTRGRTAA